MVTFMHPAHQTHREEHGNTGTNKHLQQQDKHSRS